MMQINLFRKNIIDGLVNPAAEPLPSLAQLATTSAHFGEEIQQYQQRRDLIGLIRKLEPQLHNPIAVALAIATCMVLAEQQQMVKQLTAQQYLQKTLLPALKATGALAGLTTAYKHDITALLQA